MGARPVAAMNALRFGAPENERTRHIVSGVVEGIGGYGNCFGVPTIGGEVNFDARYNDNCLVNAFAAGLAKADGIFLSEAKGVGLPIVYLGSKTGRDGIHGATMASAEFDDDSEEKRPTVQIGDPFSEKLLLEACLELMKTGAVIAIQDMGAAGLTCSAVEMGAKGNLGVRLDLDKVPCREEGMTAYEMMLSESQERMLMVLDPDKEDEAAAIFKKWDLDFAIVGETTDDQRFKVYRHNDLMADLPIKELGDEAPEYDRPWVESPKQDPVGAADVPAPDDLGEALIKLVGLPDMCSRRWVWEQYDNLIQGNTMAGPGGDAAVIRVGDQGKGLAFAVDVTPRYCEADPIEGGKQAVAECWRNITAVGGEPLAATDNLNFGNPEKPEIMGQFVGCIQGIGESLLRPRHAHRFGKRLALQRDQRPGHFTDTCDRRRRAAAGCLETRGQKLRRRRRDHSADRQRMKVIWARAFTSAILSAKRLALRRRWTLRLRKSTAPLYAPPSETGGSRPCMTFPMEGFWWPSRRWELGARLALTLTPNGEIPLHAWAFGEDQACYVVTVPASTAESFVKDALSAGIPTQAIGTTGGHELTVEGSDPISLADLDAAYEGWLPSYMSAPDTH